MDMHERKDQTLHLMFLDWKKAFDSVTHDAIQASLIRVGVPEPMVMAIMALYANPKFQVRDCKNTSDAYPQGRGVRQGCPLSPRLFIIILTEIMHDTEVAFETKNGYKPWFCSAISPLWDIEYADDTVLISKESTEMERLLQNL